MKLVKLVVLKALQAFIVLGAITIGLGIAVWLYPPLFPLGLAQLDRSPFCPRDEAYPAAQRRYNLVKTIGKVQGALHLIETDPEGYELWQTGSGKFWIPEGQIGALSITIAEQRVDLYGGSAFRVREGDIVFDCKAGAGAYAREALQAGAAKVVALEYDPRLRESLRRNFKDAISEGKLVIRPEDDTKSASAGMGTASLQRVILTPDETPSSETMASLKIDALVEGLKIERVDVIKMATHGVALNVLDGARNTIREHRPRLAVATQESEDDANKVTEWLAALNVGYAPACQVCGISPDLFVQPDIVLFQAPAL
jgi:FkbM family methyltransferase